MKPDKADRMTDYFELRSWGESPEDAALRKRLDDGEAAEYEQAYQRSQKGRAAA